MRCLFFMCSESTAIDAPTGRLNIFHVIEELTATSFPVLVSQLHMVAMIERTLQEPDTVNATAHVTLDGTPVGSEMPLTMDFREHERTKIVANLQGIVLPKPGKVRVLLKTGGTVLGVWEMHLRFVQQQRPGVQPVQAAPAPQATASSTSGESSSAQESASDPQIGEKLKKLQRGGRKSE